MKNILKNVSDRMWKGKVIMVSFFLFAGCMYDESIAPSDNHDSSTKMSAAGSAVMGNDVSGEMKKVFTAHLMGDNEVPPVDSDGQGQAIFTLNESGTELHYKLIVANIDNITQAHIHCGPTGVNGPVVVFLFGFDAMGVNKNGILAEGTITSANIIARPSSEACMGGLATFENLLERMRNSEVYVNVHTLAYPGGEIRGQIK
jgi:hypothetical protein